MAGRSIGATLVLKAGEFFANAKKAEAGVENLKKKFKSGISENKKYKSSIDNTSNSLKSMAKSVVGAVGAYVGFREAKDFVVDCCSGVMELERANTRLSTLMLNTKGNTQEMADGIIKYGDALELVTTIEGDATVAGASQLATFQLQGDNIKKLLPSLQNLAVGQYGVNVTQENMIQSANLLGKVMNGQTGALSKAGVSFTEQQKKILQTGTESQKTSALIEVLDQNFGGLAEKMAQTDEGKMIQLRNVVGSVKDEFGFALMPAVSKFVTYLTGKIPTIRDGISNAMQYVEPIAARVGNGIETACMLAGNTIKWLGDNWNWLKPTIMGVVGVILLYKGAMAALTIGANLHTIATKAMSTATIIHNGVSKAAFALSNTEMGIRVGLMALKAKDAIATGAMTVAQGIHTGVVTAATAAQWALNAAFMASPIGWIVLGIAALIGVFVLLWNKCEGFRNVCKELWATIKNGAVAMWTGIKEAFTNGIEKIKELWNKLKEFLKNPIKGVVNLFKKTDEDGDGGGEYVDGSHARGLSRVPFDGYIARLHKNERVLTAEENRQYISGGSKTTSNVFKFYITTNELDDEAVDKFASKVQFALANM